MADKLDWLNKHLVFLRYVSVGEAVTGENYKIPDHLEEFFSGEGTGEQVAFKLAAAGKHKEACELLSYLGHRRAAVWWGYRCVLSLREELGGMPAQERDIADIGANFDVKVPDFAKGKIPPKPDLSPFDKLFSQLSAQTQAMRAKADPQMQKMVEEGVELAFQEFKKVNGIHPVDLVKQLGALMQKDPFQVDPNSPAFKAHDELKGKLQALQKDTVDTIKSVLPPKVPAKEKKKQDEALDAVYRWVVAPTDENSKAAMDLGNQCTDSPSGLLALAAFWAGGNLTPGAEQIVPTPSGLAANGVTQVLLMCALAKGGNRKPKERFETYFNLGVDVLSGKDNWEEPLANGKAPHREAVAASPEAGAAGGQARYSRWKPEAPR